MERLEDYGYCFMEEEVKPVNTIEVYMSNQGKRNKINVSMDVINSLGDFRSAIFNRLENYIIRILNRMAKNSSLDLNFDGLSGGELILAMKKASEKKEFQKMLNEIEDGVTAFQEIWKTEYEATNLGFDIETGKQVIRQIISPYSLRKEHLIVVRAKTSIGNLSEISCFGNDNIISTIYGKDESMEDNIMKEIIFEDAMEILPKHEGELRANIKALERLLNSFERKAEAFLVAKEIAEQT